jgi:imidazolonepropionase-like amidohydrolase
MTATLFSNVRIFDGSGSPCSPGEVLVRGAHIIAMACGDECVPRDDATVVDGNGMTLMPGMVEAHAHLTWPSSVGAICAGNLADILLVAGDPTDDVTILQDKASLAAIMKGGCFHKRAAPTQH